MLLNICMMFLTFGSINAENFTRNEEYARGLFTIFTFENTECYSDLGTGTCLTEQQCAECSGSNQGSCAHGFGCGAILEFNNTYITSSNQDVSSCEYSIKAPDGVCQVRLDFETFVLDGPTDNSMADLGGLCSTDTFRIDQLNSPQSPTLCGYNSGQHLYFDVYSGETANLIFDIQSSSASYNVLVRYIECGQSYPGCNQYFTGSTGLISSFNFLNPDISKQVHLAGMDYTICIRREANHCCIKYIATENPDGFETNEVTCTSDCNTAVTCRANGRDYLLIPQGSEDGLNPQSFTRFCGPLLNVFSASTAEHPIITCSVPFNLHFHSAVEGNSGNTRGFNLRYRQLPCRKS